MNLKSILSLFFIFIFIQSTIACSEDNYKEIDEAYVEISTFTNSNDSVTKIDTVEIDSVIPSPIDTSKYNSGTVLSEQTTLKIRYSVRIIGKDIIRGTSFSYNGAPYSGQGVAIYNNYMFRLYHTGVCSVFDISDIHNIKHINSFALGSISSVNHANCAQFANDPTETGFPLLYVSYNHSYTKCVVEKVSLSGSEIIHSYYGSGQIPNVIIGDDGNLWGIGSNSGSNNDYHLIFWKHNISFNGNLDFNEQSTTATDVFTDYSENIPRTWQGAKVKNGKIFFLLGAKGNETQIRVYDIKTHKRIGVINLANITTAEPEDIEIWQDNKIILTLNGANYALLIEFENNPYFP